MKYFIKVMNNFVCVEARYELLQKCLKPFSIRKAKGIQFWIDLGEDGLNKRIQRNPSISKEEVEYIYTGKDFNEAVLALNGFLLESFTVSINKKGYVFCGFDNEQQDRILSILKKEFPDAYILGYDGILLKIADKKTYLYNTPWTGKKQPVSTKSSLLKRIIVNDYSSEDDFKDYQYKIKILKQYIQKSESASSTAHLSDALSLLVKKHHCSQLTDAFTEKDILSLIERAKKKSEKK